MPDQEGDLSKRAQTTATRWGLGLETPLQIGTKRVVYKVSTKNGPAVLKVNRNLGAEGGAVPFMKYAPPDVAPKLLRVSPLRRAILMEWLEGPTLADIYNQGDETTAELRLAHVAAQLKTYRVKYGFAFTSLSKGINHRFKRSAETASVGPDAKQFQRATSLFDTLVETTQKESIIHGDLHFENVILTPNGPRMIDAKGFRGDPAADCARVLTGPDEAGSLKEFCDRITRRADVIGAIIQEDPLRIIRWGAVIWSNAIFYRQMRQPKSVYDSRRLSAYLDLAKA